jgi:hypothetical protein
MKVIVSQPFAPEVSFDCFDGWRADQMQQRVTRVLTVWSNITGLNWRNVVTEATNGEDEMIVVESPIANRPDVTMTWKAPK